MWDVYESNAKLVNTFFNLIISPRKSGGLKMFSSISTASPWEQFTWQLCNTDLYTNRRSENFKIYFQQATYIWQILRVLDPSLKWLAHQQSLQKPDNSIDNLNQVCLIRGKHVK